MLLRLKLYIADSTAQTLIGGWTYLDRGLDSGTLVASDWPMDDVFVEVLQSELLQKRSNC